MRIHYKYEHYFTDVILVVPDVLQRWMSKVRGMASESNSTVFPIAKLLSLTSFLDIRKAPSWLRNEEKRIYIYIYIYVTDVDSDSKRRTVFVLR